MSSKKRPTITNEEAGPALVPKLRFPEFLESEAWHFTYLGSVCEILNNRRRPISGNERTPGPYPYYGASGIVDYVSDFIFDERLLLVGEDGAKWGAFEKTAFIAEGKYWVNNHAHVLKPFAANDTLLENYLTIRDLSPFVTGAAPPKLTLGKLKSIPVPLPPTTAEQIRIAEWLSSVDELIAAQARKVDALKTHKKGLMQQLFPREGETQPRLRFPEFRDAGEWVCEELSSCLKKVIDYRGIAPPKSESGVPLITAKNVKFGWLDMANDEYIEEDKYDEWMSRGIPQAGDILFTTEAPLGNVALFPPSGKFALGQRLLTLRSKPERCVPAFLFHSLLGPTMQAEIAFHGTGSTAKGIKSKVFVKLSFCRPGVQEQQRIADCLSSLDALIATETKNLEALKIHKKGLMQQLFPAPETVEA